MSRVLRLHLGVFGLYLLVACVITWPLVTVLASRFAGFGYGDAYEMAHHIWWFKYALQTGQSLFFQPMLGYPQGIQGITLWSNPLQFFPAWLFAFVMPLPAAYNVPLLLTMALNGWSMFRLTRYLTHQTGPALLAGLIYLAFPIMQGHLAAGHAGLLVQWPVPLYVYCLFRLRETGANRWIVLGALFFILSALGHTLQLIYVLMPVTALFALVLLIRREWGALGRVLLAAAPGAIALGIFLLPVARVTLASDAYSAEGSVRYSADLLGIVTPSFFDPIFRSWEYTHRVLGVNIDEGYAYIGLIVAALAVVAVWRVRAARWWLALAIVAWILSLGPLLKVFDQPVRVRVENYESFVTMPGALLERVPLLNLGRTPGRFNFTLALAVSVLAAYGLSRFWLRLRHVRWGVLVVAFVLILFEYQGFWNLETGFPELPTVPAAVPQAIRDLTNRDDVRAVLDVPWENLVSAKEGLYLQTIHLHALIAGHVTRRTPVDPAKLTLLEATFDPALLNDAGADIVIVHRDYDPSNLLRDRARQVLGAPIYEDSRFAIFQRPDSTTTPTFIVQRTDEPSVKDEADSSLYAPISGWSLWTASLDANDRDTSLWLDGAPLQHWTLDGVQNVSVPIPLTAGYHTVALTVDPPCPTAFNAALRCKSVDVSSITFGDLISQTFEPSQYGNGVTLAGARLGEITPERLSMWLWWQFSAPRSENDIRFVHVVDENGAPIAQLDQTTGERTAGDQLAEVVSIDLPPDLAPGTYHIYTGWYTYPDLTRFPVLSDVPGKQDNYVLVGQFTK